MVQTDERSQRMMYNIRGNVHISPDVAIAPDVVLEAVPGSRLVIADGVCLGSGVIVQAYGGDLVVAAHASVGKDVLLVGTGRVGERACIGAESTLINPQVEEDSVIVARSLLGVPTPTSTAAVASEVTSTAPASKGPEADVAPPAEHNGALTTPATVYGREQVMQLVKTLFPHRDLLNQNGNGQSSTPKNP
jgi:carbon dioxide concentrating mechanism protein CcmN